MNTHSQKIATLLHASRRSDWTNEQTHELSAALRESTHDEIVMANLAFAQDLLAASRQVLLLQVDMQAAAQGPIH